MTAKLNYIIICFLLIFASQELKAQEDNKTRNLSISPNSYFTSDSSSIGLAFKNHQKEGPNRFFTFHDHDPKFGAANFHEHLYLDPFEEITERFSIVQLEASYQLNRRIKANIELPWHTSTRIFPIEDSIKRQSGIGDLQVGFQYVLYEEAPRLQSSSLRQFLIGEIQLGIPTGQYRIKDAENDIEPHLQPGTGSLAFNPAILYHIDYKKWAFNAKAAFRTYRPNIFQYRPGNDWHLHSRIRFAALQKTNFALETGLAVHWWRHEEDLMNKSLTGEETSFTTFNLMPTVNLQYRKLIIEISHQIPIMQQQGDSALQFNYISQAKLKWQL